LYHAEAGIYFARWRRQEQVFALFLFVGDGGQGGLLQSVRIGCGNKIFLIFFAVIINARRR
jgi:hypothetical protein